MIKTLFAAGIEHAACRSKAEPVTIWKARKYIEEHADEKVSLTKVANAVNGNANYLSERFKQVTGTKFVEYVARIRVEKAYRLLHDGNLRISDIAFAAGFQSLSQFNRIFKKLSGVSPTQFRTANRVGRQCHSFDSPSPKCPKK